MEKLKSLILTGQEVNDRGYSEIVQINSDEIEDYKEIISQCNSQNKATLVVDFYQYENLENQALIAIKGDSFQAFSIISILRGKKGFFPTISAVDSCERLHFVFSHSFKTQEHSVSNIHPITIGVNTQSLATIDAATQPEAPAEAQEPKQSQEPQQSQGTEVNEPQAETTKDTEEEAPKITAEQAITYIHDALNSIRMTNICEPGDFNDFDKYKHFQTLSLPCFDVEISGTGLKRDGIGSLIIKLKIPNVQGAYEIKLSIGDSKIHSAEELSELIQTILMGDEVLNITYPKRKVLQSFGEKFSELQLKHETIARNSSESRREGTLEFIKSQFPIDPNQLCEFEPSNAEQDLRHILPGLHVHVLQGDIYNDRLIPGNVTVYIKDPKSKPYQAGAEYETYARAKEQLTSVSKGQPAVVASKEQLADIVNKLLSQILQR